jgi:hypothetical protein
MAPNEPALNYPDVLGALTNNVRATVGPLQLALGVRPRAVKAGRPMEVLLVAQNMADVPIDLSATLQLPETDAAKRKGRFLTQTPKLVVQLEAGEVGYIMLPVTTLPDTAVSADYKMGMEIKTTVIAKQGGKPLPVRTTNGGAPLDMAQLSETGRQNFDSLKGVLFSSALRGGLLAGPTLEANFSVMPGKLAELIDFKPGWVNLWTVADHQDKRLLFAQHQEVLTTKLLPLLTRKAMYEPLLQATQARFEKGGYALSEIEARLVARVLTLILEYANPRDLEAGGHGGIAAGAYNLLPFLSTERMQDAQEVNLPRWIKAYLKLLSAEPRAAEFPVQAITRVVYPELLRDGGVYAFQLLEQASGEDLGTPDEMVAYMDALVQAMNDGKLDFMQVYMPLVLGGVTVFNDQVLMPSDDLKTMVSQMLEMLTKHQAERNDDTEIVFTLARRVLLRALSKYGYRGEN